MAYTVKTEQFEGALDVLLVLIEKRKLLINDFSLSSVADDFIAFVHTHPEYPIEEASHFILVACTLLVIKSKSLLPVITLSEDEQSDIEDLKLRLSLHQLFSTQARRIAAAFNAHPLFFPERYRQTEVVFAPDQKVTIASLLAQLRGIITQLPKNTPALPVANVRTVVTLEETIVRLHKRITSAAHMLFSDFVGTKEEKVTVIVSFLALLELVRQGIVRVNQNEHFSDILIEHDHVTTPYYG